MDHLQVPCSPAVIDRFDAYLSHMSTLAQDKATKSDDKGRLVGYIRNSVA